MTDALNRGREILAAQPFSALLETELVAYSTSGAEVHVPITERVKQQNGFVHGGVISYAADNALAFAGGAELGPDVVTSEFKINYVRPALGTRLVARASVIHAGRNQAVCRCDVFAQDGQGERLCATALGTITRIAGAK